MILTSLDEVKTFLEIDPRNTTYDRRLLLLMEQASNYIETYCGRDFTYKTRTQYYCGTNSQNLVLKNRPVFPLPTNPAFSIPNLPPFADITVVHDRNGYFGAASGSFTPPSATTLVYGIDFTLRIDQDDGSSRSAILMRINNSWLRPSVRQAGYLSPFIWDDQGSYKVTYTAGWTVDSLPAVFREATNLLVAKMRYVFPLGLIIGSESYEERSFSVIEEKKDYWLSLIRPLLFSYRNYSF